MADKSYKLTLSLSDGSTINAGTITAPQGPNGANGATFTPSVSAAGVLSWTNNGGLTNPSPISIKGPKGDDAVITESDVKGWGFTKNEGTITEIKMNGVSKGKSGVVDLGAVLTAHTGLVGGNLVQYDSSAQTLKDSGKKISDLATASQVNAKYTKPSGGIPKTDLASNVQTSLGKADNAMPKAGGAFTGAVTIQAPTAEMNPATKQYVDTAINAVKQFEYQVVTELPTAAQATMGKIYLKAHSHNPSDGQPDSYDEFITVKSGSTYKWERIGNTDIDLSGYVPTTRKINNKALSSDINLGASDVGVTEAAFPGLNKTGTITGITMNGASKGTSGVVDLGTVLTSSDNLAKLDTENTFTAKQTINSGYGTVSLKTQGYVEINASWLSGNLGGLLGIKRDDTSGRIYAVATKNLGLVSAIRINNSTKQPDGDCVVDLGTVLTTHQTIKTLKTNNDTAQEVSASEALSGSGTINLHKVAKTGSYNDLLNKPTIPTDTGATSVEVTGTGNAVTAASYNATNRKLTLTKGSTFLTSHQDISGKANLSGGNTFTGKQTLNSPGSDGYSINAAGYIKGSWLQSGVKSNKGSGTGMVCVFDDSGWIYYRTPSEILTEAGGAKASDIPTFELSGDTLIINF